MQGGWGPPPGGGYGPPGGGGGGYGQPPPGGAPPGSMGGPPGYGAPPPGGGYAPTNPYGAPAGPPGMGMGMGGAQFGNYEFNDFENSIIDKTAGVSIPLVDNEALNAVGKAIRSTLPEPRTMAGYYQIIELTR